PMLSDLRESGAIEQDADLVMLLYRDAYYNEEAKKLADETGTELLEINIAKHRNGATRRFNVVFEAATNALMNLESEGGPRE
ncbi:MAG: replicative DNA helicase, partial [Solobacterium sp.]|nr:replicative DNA helicase [Solobacterium sp.]